MIEGLVRIVLDGKTVEATAGTSVYIPAGIVHQFSNPGPERARMMEIDTPGNFQAYFEELGQAFPIGTPIDQAWMVHIQQQYDFIPVH